MAPQTSCGLYEIASPKRANRPRAAHCAPRLKGREKAGLSSKALGLSIGPVGLGGLPGLGCRGCLKGEQDVATAAPLFPVAGLEQAGKAVFLPAAGVVDLHEDPGRPKLARSGADEGHQRLVLKALD